MADFDSDWKITGSPDPATPDPQPHQVQAQPQAPVQPAQPVSPAFRPQAPVQSSVPQQRMPVNAQPVVIGYNINGPVYRNANGFVMPATREDHTAEREANLNEIAKMINHFSPKLEVYQDYEKCYQEILKYNNRSVAPFVWGILIMLQSFAAFFLATSSKFKDTIMMYVIAGLVIFLIGAAFVALYFIKKKRHAQKLEVLFEKFEELSNNLKIIYNGYSNCALPAEYTDPRLLYQFQSMIYQGRVFSIGAALNSMLAAPTVYKKITEAKKQFELDTAEKFNGKKAFFSAARFFGIK